MELTLASDTQSSHVNIEKIRPEVAEHLPIGFSHEFALQVPVVPKKLRWLTLLDYIVVSFIITPLVVSYWRATWMLMDQLIFHDNPKKSAAVTSSIGLLIIVLSYALQDKLKCFLYAKSIKSVKWIMGYHLFLYIMGISTIGLWRGVWLLLDEFTNTDINSHVTSLALGWGALVLLRSLMNAIASPLSVTTDISDTILDCSVRFRAEAREGIENFALDVLFTCCVMYGLVVTLWRGLWGIADDLLAPGSGSISALLSLGPGYGLVVLAITFQYSAQSSSEAMVKDFPFILRVALQDVLVTIGVVGVVNVWRGIWTLHDIWLTKHPVMWVLATNHYLCIIGLMLIAAGSSVYVRGCMRDGESAIFPLFYIRYFCRNRFYEKVDGVKSSPAGKNYPGCSCNHYCLLLNVLRERNSREKIGSYNVRACIKQQDVITIHL